ncbi:MAG TPA: hypothetical protein VKU80_10130 [Planctomycetota bacterium]|nr:hypothetical protein [Planctomycetota bacterium]
MPEQRRRSLTFLLVGFVLLVTVAGLFALVPLMVCPNCELTRAQMGHNNNWKPGMPEAPLPKCGYCRSQRKATLLKHWIWVWYHPKST